MRKAQGIFVENYPSPSAGAPISDEKAKKPDLGSYMQSCGALGNPKYFETAELLMTTGLTDSDKDKHLKSEMVSC